MQKEKIDLFKPYLPTSARNRARKQMDTRWLGQGPLVDEFEVEFERQICYPHKAIAVNSGTSALHLAYILAGVKENDEVIGPVFTCSATYSGVLYQRAKVVFADIKKHSLTIDPEHVEQLLKQRGEKVKAIVAVHYAGYPCEMDKLLELGRKYNVTVIEDAAQAIGASYKRQPIGTLSPFTAFSFQAIKTMTTADGGMLSIKDPSLEEKAKRIRWFGIDRKAKFEDRWLKDIWELGYKYQMTDIEAAMGLEGLKELDHIINHSKKLFETYDKELKGVAGITLLNKPALWDDLEPSYWICTVSVERREDLKRKLSENLIESDPVHYRNDRYTIYGGRVYNCPNMDFLEDKYLVLPMHYYLQVEDVKRICQVIKEGW